MTDLGSSSSKAAIALQQLIKLCELYSDAQTLLRAFKQRERETLSRAVYYGIQPFLYLQPDPKSFPLDIFSFQERLAKLQEELQASPRPEERALVEVLSPLEAELNRFLKGRQTSFFKQAIAIADDYPWARVNANFISQRPFHELYHTQFLRPTREGVDKLMRLARGLPVKLAQATLPPEEGEVQQLQESLDELEVQYLLFSLEPDDLGPATA